MFHVLLKLEDVSRLNTLGGLGHFLSVSKTLLVAIRVLALVGATIVANWLFRIRRGTRPSRPPTLLTVLTQTRGGQVRNHRTGGTFVLADRPSRHGVTTVRRRRDGLC